MDPAMEPQLLQRVERARRVVSLCSQAIIRAYDEEALLAEACRLLIDVGNYAIAWVGETAAGSMVLAALGHAGVETSGVRGVLPPWTDIGARSPTGRAIREQRPQVVRGIPDEAALQTRHPEAALLGYASLCAFPVQFGPYGTGALTVYAREPDAFAPEEVALLRELSGDLAVGVAVLRARRSNEALEERLESAERRFRSLVERAPIGILQVDALGHVVIANQALCDLLGYATPAGVEALGATDVERHLDEADRLAIERSVRGGPPFVAFDVHLRRLDGTRRWVEVNVQAGPETAAGVVEAFVRDLTATREAHIASSRLAAFVNSSEEALVGVDTAGIVQSWSAGAAAMYGYDEAESIGKALPDLIVPPDRRPEWSAHLNALLAGEHVPRFETLRVCKRGQLKEVSVAASPVLDREGHVVGAAFMAHEIGERKRAQAALLAQDRQRQEVARLQEFARMRSDFISRASHELNTPLTPILLQVQALKELRGLDAKQSMGLAVIERNVLRLAMLVKDLLAAADFGTERLELNPSDIDLSELLSDAVDSLQPQAATLGITLRVAPGGEVPSFADRERIMQVLFNLLGNAIKFTPRGGSVTVEAMQREDRSTVTVKDTGIGFAAPETSLLFRPFSRLHEDMPGTPVGTGLGLFIAKGIIEGSGGEIWAASPGPGQGCTVGFTLPGNGPLRPGRGIVAAKGFYETVAPPDPLTGIRPFNPAPTAVARDRPAQDVAARTRSK